MITQTINKTKIDEVVGYEKELNVLDKFIIHLKSENKRKDLLIEEQGVLLEQKDDEIAKLKRQLEMFVNNVGK